MLKSLFILPFDHRNTFAKKFKNITELKQVVYQGFEWAIKEGDVPKESAAILIDEQYGQAILEDALSKGYIFCLAVEKSGQDEFDFEYGDDFGGHINKYRPTYVKALVRYNPEGDTELNYRQRQKLKKLNDFCKNNHHRFLIEPLVLAIENQLAQVAADKNRYDNEIRPRLMVKMIKELQENGIEPDVWKIEGLENPKDYQSLVAQIKSGGRDNANAIVLGRGADQAQVEKWLISGAKISGIIGFAIGRTIFWQSLIDYTEGKISKDTAISQIAEKYRHFYQIFNAAK